MILPVNSIPVMIDGDLSDIVLNEKRRLLYERTIILESGRTAG